MMNGRTQDGGYNGGQNTYDNENTDSRRYGEREVRNGGLPEPSGRVGLEGYKKGDSNGAEEPRYNPVST